MGSGFQSHAPGTPTNQVIDVLEYTMPYPKVLYEDPPYQCASDFTKGLYPNARFYIQGPSTELPGASSTGHGPSGL